MTDFILDTNPIYPLSEKNPKQIIVLCHGYGGDGKDISALAINWRRFLPDAVFLCPNAPEICSVNPNGYQWFELSSENENLILEKSLIAEKKLDKYLDEALEKFQIKADKLAIVGFSQGCMIGIQVALKKKKQIGCMIGYSGKIISKKHLSTNINSSPKIFLMHGSNDTIVPPTHLLEAKEFLKNHGLKIKMKLFKNCEHRIPVEGSSLGLAFLKKNLL
tara:strand:- start:9296 stop:9952 length:657 start_codon:yes stop_codon:yes gene_type:complete